MKQNNTIVLLAYRVLRKLGLGDISVNEDS